MSVSLDEPTLPPRLRRPLAAVWISLGLHAALIALVQVAPPAPVRLGEPAIEARLLPAHTEPVAAEAPRVPEAKTPDGPPDQTPVQRFAPTEAAAGKTAAEPEPEPVAGPRTGESAAEPDAPNTSAALPAPAVAISSTVDLTYYSARDLDVQPRALHEIEPVYPDDADRRRLSGSVRLQLKLEADGRIGDIEVVSATPPGVFDESAIGAFRDARFVPAQKNGRPVRARVVIEVLYDWEGRARNQ